MRANTILDTIGDTPHVRINRLYAAVAPKGVEVWLSDDDRRVLLQLKSKLSVGSINLYLTSSNTALASAR